MESKVREHKLTYGTLWRYYEETKTNLALCLSEFIDNSISSWKKGPMNEQLLIQIRYYDIDKNTKMYAIVDNANGMTDLELDNAMIQYNDTFDKDNSSFNQYGIGMKFGIFWIGRDAEIYTRTPNGKLYVGKYNAKGKRASDVVKSTVQESTRSPVCNLEHGTCILIKEVYGGKRSITETKLKELTHFLGYRYSNYIVTGELKIEIEKFVKGYGPECKDLLSSGVIKPFSISTDKKSILTFSKLVPEAYKRELIKEKYLPRLHEIEQEIQKLENNPYFSPSRDYALSRLIIKKQTYDRFFNDEEMLFDDELTIIDSTNKKLGNDDIVLGEAIKAKIKIMFLSSPSKNKNGLSILHNGRYIYHPTTNKSSENVSKNYEMAEERWNGGVHKWLAAELSLEDIETNQSSKYIKPDKNKSEIVFVDNLYDDGFDETLDEENDISQRILTKLNFDEALKTLLNDYLEFLVMVKDINEGNVIEKSDKDAISNNIDNDQFSGDLSYNFTSNSYNIDNSNSNKLTDFVFSLDGDNDKKVEIKVVDSEDTEWLIKLESDEDNKSIKYLYNRNHKYFDLSKNTIKSLQNNYATLLIYLDAVFRRQDGFETIRSVDEAIQIIMDLRGKNE